MTLTDRTHSTSGDQKHTTQGISGQDQPELKIFHYSDYNLKDLDHEIDPDNNFFSTCRNNCHYYTDEQYNQNIKSKDKLSIIHFNSRNLYVNLNNIKEFLQKFSHPFNIIAVSET